MAPAFSQPDRDSIWRCLVAGWTIERKEAHGLVFNLAAAL